MFRLCLIVLSCLLFLPGISAAETTRHIVQPPTWSDHPSAPESMNDRLDKAAMRYELEAPIPRILFYDIAYPGNDAELAAMKGYAVMLVTTVSQDAAELPLARVYVVVDGKQVALTRITGSSSTLPADSHPAEVFGQHRWDGLYLLPIYAIESGNYAAADYAVHRKGFVFAQFLSSTQQELGYTHPVTRPPRVKRPPQAALRKLVMREFPGFMHSGHAKGTPDSSAKPAP